MSTELQELREWKHTASALLDRYSAAVDLTFNLQPGESRVAVLERELAKLRRIELIPRINQGETR